MKQEKILEVFSNLTKQVSIITVEDKILQGSLVFEALNQFPGYYHEVPIHPQPIYIYLVLERQYPLEEILRVTQNIEQKYNWNFDSGKGYMHIGTEFLNIIRLRHLSEIDMVEKIQEAYQQQGVNFLMNMKLKGKLEAEVKIVKFMNLITLNEDIWVEEIDQNFGYFKIPVYLNSNDFRKVTMDVKYNWLGHEFDAASGSFYHNGKLIEFVRILSNKIDLDYLMALQKLYLKKI